MRKRQPPVANELVSARSSHRYSTDRIQSFGRAMIRKLKSGQYRLYSRKKNAAGKRRNLGTFSTRKAAEAHERAVQFFKRR